MYLIDPALHIRIAEGLNQPNSVQGADHSVIAHNCLRLHVRVCTPLCFAVFLAWVRLVCRHPASVAGHETMPYYNLQRWVEKIDWTGLRIRLINADGYVSAWDGVLLRVLYFCECRSGDAAFTATYVATRVAQPIHIALQSSLPGALSTCAQHSGLTTGFPLYVVNRFSGRLQSFWLHSYFVLCIACH